MTSVPFDSRCLTRFVVAGIVSHEIESRNHCNIILLRIENERLEFQVQNILWHVFFALSMPQEHLKQNKESDVYFTCTVGSCGKIPFNG